MPHDDRPIIFAPGEQVEHQTKHDRVSSTSEGTSFGKRSYLQVKRIELTLNAHHSRTPSSRSYCNILFRHHQEVPLGREGRSRAGYCNPGISFVTKFKLGESTWFPHDLERSIPGRPQQCFGLPHREMTYRILPPL